MKEIKRPTRIGRETHVSVDTTATTSDQSIAFDVERIEFISNDSESYNLKVNFDTSTAEAGAITLKPGEVLGPIDRKVTNLHYAGVSGSVAFRAVGVK